MCSLEVVRLQQDRRQIDRLVTRQKHSGERLAMTRRQHQLLNTLSVKRESFVELENERLSRCPGFMRSAWLSSRIIARCNRQPASLPVVKRLCHGTADASRQDMKPILKLLGLGQSRDEPPLPCFKALSAASLTRARRRAGRVLENAKRCQRCRTLLAHVFDCVGSTLFLDDDPHALISSFKPTLCDQFSEQVLAALIVLQGRPRTRPQYA
jgi:hypothetical protein